MAELKSVERPQTLKGRRRAFQIRLTFFRLFLSMARPWLAYIWFLSILNSQGLIWFPSFPIDQKKKLFEQSNETNLLQGSAYSQDIFINKELN